MKNICQLLEWLWFRFHPERERERERKAHNIWMGNNSVWIKMTNEFGVDVEFCQQIDRAIIKWDKMRKRDEQTRFVKYMIH